MSSESEHSYGWESLDEDDNRNIAEKNTRTQVKLEMLSDEEEPKIKREYVSDTCSDGEDAVNLDKIPDRLMDGNICVNPIEKKMTIFSQSLSLSKNNPNELILKNYLSANTDLNKISCDSIEDINEDDDVWLVQCPKKINLSALRDVDLLQKSKKIKLNETVFECISLYDDERVNTISLISPQVSNSANGKIMQQCKVNNVLLLREKLKSSYDVEVAYDPMDKIPFPTGLKKRHPLFGVQYKNQLKLPSTVVEKLNNPTELKEISQKSTKNIEKVPVAKSTKKRKNKGDSHSLEILPSKRIKIEHTDVWMSEISIEKELFELPVKSIKKEKRLCH